MRPKQGQLGPLITQGWRPIRCQDRADVRLVHRKRLVSPLLVGIWPVLISVYTHCLPDSCKVPSMSGEALAEELKNIQKRYRHAVFSLDIFVRDSLKGIDRRRGEIVAALTDLRALPHISKKALASLKDGSPLDPNADDADDDLKPIIMKALAENLRIVEPHSRMLLEMSIAYASALFDGLVSDVLLTIFRHVPEALRSGRTLTTAEVLGFPSREDLIEELARRETLELAYKSAEAQFSYFQRAFNVDVFDSQPDVTIADLAAVRERRNLIIHNNGLANAFYIAKYCPAGSIGDPVIVNAESAESDREILRKIGMALMFSFTVKFAPSENS